MLRTTPLNFQQETCRHFLAKAYERFRGLAFANYTYQEFSLDNLTSLRSGTVTRHVSPSPHIITEIKLEIGAEGEDNSQLYKFCDYHGELDPRQLSSDGIDESYMIQVKSSSIDVTAVTPIGVLRAFSTLAQLVQWDGTQHVINSCSNSSQVSLSMPLLTIKDAPRFPWRGLMVDTSRHFYPMATLRRIVDGMEMLKLSVLHWHIVDAQSFPYVSSVFPNLSSEGAFSEEAIYTQKDVKEFIRYCADRGIRLVPEFDVPGHTASWGKGYPHLTVNCPQQVEADPSTSVPMREHGIDRVAMNPLQNTTYDFLDSFFKESFTVFPDAMMHIGGDEVNGDCWSTDPGIGAWARAHGVMWANELQGLFEQRVMKMLQVGGKHAVVWDEVLDMPGAASWMRPGTVVQWWRGWVRDAPAKAARAGLNVIMSAPWYLDHVGDDWLKMYKAPIYEDFTNSAGGGADKGGGKLLGGEACSWSEHANNANVEHRIFSRLPAVAERLWSSAEVTDPAINMPSRAHLARRYGAALCSLHQRAGLSVGPAYPDFCRGPQGLGERNGGTSEVENALKQNLLSALNSMREWQFLAFAFGAVIFFGCVAIMALCVARNCHPRRQRGVRKTQRADRKAIESIELGRKTKVAYSDENDPSRNEKDRGKDGDRGNYADDVSLETQGLLSLSS